MNTVIAVSRIMERLAREERKLKNAGAYAEAAGVRDALVVVLRMVDEELPSESIEPSGDTQ